jgi:curved DNA-binding protein CbpA
MFMIDLGAESYYSLLNISPTATTAEIRQARDSIVKELRERQRREPTNRAELEERQKAVNAAGEELVRPAKRAKYDQENAHLRFFTLRNAATPLFTDPGHRIDVLHRAIRAHLRGAGVALRPLSDVDKTDFATDETPNELLDELLARYAAPPAPGQSPATQTRMPTEP